VFRWCLFFVCERISDKLLEQRLNTKFLVKVGKNATDIYKILQQLYGEETMNNRLLCRLSNFKTREMLEAMKDLDIWQFQELMKCGKSEVLRSDHPINCSEDCRRTAQEQRNCEIDFDWSSEDKESLFQNGTKKSQ